MKQRIIFLAIALATAMGTSAQIYGLPFYQDFENGLQAWSVYDTPCGLINDPDQAHSGNYCYKFCGWTEGGSGDCLFLQSPYLNNLDADTVQVTFYARGGANISIMRWDNSSNPSFTWDNQTTSEWQRFSVTVPTGHSFIGFYSNASSNQPLWIDDLVITNVERDIVNGDASQFSRISEDGNLLFYQITSDSTVRIVRDDSYQSMTGEVTIPATVTRQGSTYMVTSIGMSAFEGCNITSVLLPTTIDTIEDLAFMSCNRLFSYTLPDCIQYCGHQAFSYCGLTSIHIPASLTIESNTFHGCPNVSTVTVAAGNPRYTAVDNVLFNADQSSLYFYAPQKPNTHYDIPNTVTFSQTFYECDNLVSVTFPTSLQIMYGFDYCDALTEINIPATLSYFGGASQCASLTAIHVDPNNQSYCDVDGVLFNKEMTFLITYPCAKSNTSYAIPSNVTNIAPHAFTDCKNLNNILIPDSVQVIGYAAFQGCTSVPSLDIPSSVTSIDYNAFRNIFNINYHGTATYTDYNRYWGARHMNFTFFSEDSIYYTSATKDTVIGCHPDLHVANLPESVTVIADSAFFSHSNLSSVSLPSSLTQIGKCAFACTHGFSEITIPQNVTLIDDNAFWYCLGLNTVNFNATNCQAMGTTIADDGNCWPVFIRSVNIHTINIGENVTRIPDRSFYGCEGLRGTLTIPDAVNYIGYAAFYHYNENNIDSLRIVIGSSVQEIGNYAFYCHNHISSVTSLNPVPPTIRAATFLVYPMRLFVPCGSRSAYSADPLWNEFAVYGSGIFEDCQSIEDTDLGDDIKVYVDNDNILVSGANGLSVNIYDVMGRRVGSEQRAGNGALRLSVPTTGVYLVKIGDYHAKKVVVCW